MGGGDKEGNKGTEKGKKSLSNNPENICKFNLERYIAPMKSGDLDVNGLFA